MKPSERIDKELADLTDWRGKTLADIRRIVRDADPDVIEKWMGTPVWCHDGDVCSADAHKNVVKMIFFKGASLPDPKGLFNAELEGNTRRAIKLFEGDRVNERALKALVRAGAELNSADTRAEAAAKPKGAAKPQRAARPGIDPRRAPRRSRS